MIIPRTEPGEVLLAICMSPPPESASWTPAGRGWWDKTMNTRTHYVINPTPSVAALAGKMFTAHGWGLVAYRLAEEGFEFRPERGAWLRQAALLQTASQ